MSKASFALVLAALGLVLLDMSVCFVVPHRPMAATQALTRPQVQGTNSANHTTPTVMVVYGAALLATAAAGILARARRASGIVRKNYGGFQPVVCDSHEYANDVGYLPDGTPINQAGNNSLRAPAPPYSATATPPPAVAPPPAAAAPPVVAPPPVVGSFTTTADALHGIKFGYSMQKDAYADLEYLNDVGYLPDGTPMNKAGNCINHPETIQPDPHTPGSPLPRALLHNSVGYLPDGTPMNAAGNAVNHPDRMQPDMHVAGSPLPKSVYCADVGYLVDGTDLATAGNNSVKAAPPPTMPAAAPVASPPPVASPTPVAASFTSASTEAMHGIKFSYSMQKDAYADLEFLNDVGYLPDGTPMNKAGNCINHPETIQPDPHTPGSPLPRALLHNSVGYLPDGTPMNAAGNAVNHPDRMQPDMHVAGSPLPKSVYCADVGYLVDGTDLATAGNNSVKVPFEAASVPEPVAAAFVGAGTAPPAGKRHAIGFAYSVQKDVYADFLFGNEVGYLPDGTPMNKAGNCLNHPENIQPDPHAPGSALPRASFVNDVGYLPDGTPLNRAGNAINHPETVQPDPHSPGSALPESAYAADVGYLVDGTPLDAAGNNAVH